MKRIIFGIIATTVCAALLLTACGSNNNAAPAETTAAEETAAADVPAEYADYVGYQFSGTDPWGGELSITIRSIQDDTMEATYTDVFGDDLILYAEMSGIPISGGSAPFSPAGTAVDSNTVVFSYSGTIELKDGQLEFTYESGSVDTESSEGGSSAYHAEALDESSKTVILTKTTDPYGAN